MAVPNSIFEKEQAIRKIATGSILFFWKTVLGLRSIATVIVAIGIADWFSNLQINNELLFAILISFHDFECRMG